MGVLRGFIVIGLGFIRWHRKIWWFFVYFPNIEIHQTTQNPHNLTSASMDAVEVRRREKDERSDIKSMNKH